ncbi:MAG: phosphate signaling complex protein PhoU [Eubacteriales bacterium]|nr:phosphate signaling complex protein PhoU [Eubacteriales bacterium]
MRDYYDKQLEKLNGYVTDMGQLIENAIQNAITALLAHDKEGAENTIHFDDEIDRMERDTENLCLNLLLSQQPVATDLRLVSAALKMVTDMERIGDHAADISEITLILAGSGFPESLNSIEKMAEETIFMVKESVDAYVQRSVQKAIEVIHHDDVVDNYFVDIKKLIIWQINENIQNGEQAADILMIAKYLERIADHAVNIAEWVLFYITGEHPEVPV